MRKIIFILFFVPGIFFGQTYHSSKTKYFDPKESELIERTITVNADTITIVSKSPGVTDIQKLVINYVNEGKMKRIGKAMIYECIAAKGPFMYDIGIPLNENVKKIGVTAFDLTEKEWRDMIFLIDE